MRESSLSISTGLALACLLASFAVPAQPQPGKGGDETRIVVNNDGIGLSFAAHTRRQFLSMTVRVSAPGQGLIFSERFVEPVAQWTPPADAADGVYRWEAWVVTADSGAVAAPGHAARSQERQLEKARKGRMVPIEQRFSDELKQVRQESGTLEMRDGWLQDLSSHDREISALESAVGKVLSFIVPPAQAIQKFTESVEIEATTPRLYFDDTDLSGLNWYLEGSSNEFRIVDSQSDVIPFIIRDGAPAHSMAIDDTGNIGLGTSNPDLSLEIIQEEPGIGLTETDAATQWNLVSSNGDFHLAHFNGSLRSPFQIESDAPANALYVDTFGRVGLGTGTPTEELTISGGSFGPRIGMRTNSGTETWQFGGNTAQFFFRDASTGVIPVRVSAGAPVDSLRMDGSGNVGMGTGSPGLPLHVQRSDGSAGVLVQETSPTTAARELFKLSNNGGPFFIFENTDIAQSYSFAMGATGHFLLSHQQTSGVQMRLTPAGNLTIAGSLSEGSSRTIKDGITPIDPATVLAKLEALPVSEWSYQDVPGSRHVGPMAEDFHAVFGFGPDDKHIAPRDLAGVALAAAKALRQKTAGLEAENESLRAELAALRETVEAMRGTELP